MKRSFFVWSTLILLVMVTVSGCGGGDSNNATTGAVLLSENFDSFGTGDAFTSSSWTDFDGNAIPTWHIQEAGKVLDLESAGFIVYTGSGSSSWTNYRFTFNFKVSDTDAIASAYFRFIGGAEPGWSNYFINIDDGTLSLSKCPSDVGSCHPIAPLKAITYTANTYWPVKVEVYGNNIKVYFGGAVIPDVEYTDDGSTDGPFQPAGSIGVGSPNAPHVYFDDLVVTAL